MKKYITTFVLLATITVPFLANAQTVADLQAQAQALLAQIAQLQAQQAATPVSTTVSGNVNTSGNSCPTIGRVLKLGSTGTDVTSLQQFLALDSSVYPEGTVSGYYGSLTQAAVSRFQSKHNIVSSGSPATTGWGVVGPRTAAAIASSCLQGNSGGTTGSTGYSGGTIASTPAVGGLIQVTPISGVAPLQVNIQATVNTSGSCTPAVYVLNYGDGTTPINITLPSGNCQPSVQTFGHTYIYGGVYQVTLTSGTHQTSVAVTITGPTSPQQAALSGIPADSVKASITTGAVPLAVVFTGTVSSLSAYGCTGTCSETLNFGDGNVGLIPLPASSGTGAASWQSYVLNHTYSTAGTYTVQLQSPTGTSIGSSITIQAGSTAANTSGGTYTITNLTTALQCGGSNGCVPVITATFTIPTCASYQINWGDSSAITTQTGVCQNGGTTVTANHTYTASGSYTVTLNDGNGAAQARGSTTLTQ